MKKIGKKDMLLATLSLFLATFIVAFFQRGYLLVACTMGRRTQSIKSLVNHQMSPLLYDKWGLLDVAIEKEG